MAEIGNISRLSVEPLVPQVKAQPAAKRAAVSQPIGIFDSGVGGLTVLAEVMEELPGEDIIYLADTARIPFGSRPVEEIIKINQEILNFFLKQEIKMAIMACGTSSSLAYPVLKDRYPFPIISMIEPGSRAAAARTKNKKIGVIATQNTIDSGAFQDALLRIDKNIAAIAVACPLFVPLIEGGFIEAEETKSVAKEYLKPLIKSKVDTLILGCTHYPHLIGVLRGIIKAELVNPAEAVVAEAKRVLSRERLLKKTSSPGHSFYYVTSRAPQFEVLGSKLLGRPISGVKQVNLT